MPKTVTKKYACAICGKKDRAANMVFSKFTRNHYCRDDRACDVRMLRNYRARRAEASV